MKSPAMPGARKLILGFLDRAGSWTAYQQLRTALRPSALA